MILIALIKVFGLFFLSFSLSFFFFTLLEMADFSVHIYLAFSSKMPDNSIRFES